jgi:membrane dipeptidase
MESPIGLDEHDRVGPAFMVDGHVDLPYFMWTHGRDIVFSQLTEGPFTAKKALETGVRLFFTALYCEDRFNGDRALDQFKEVHRFTLNLLDQVSIVYDLTGLRRLSRDPSEMGTLFVLENGDALAGDDRLVEMLRAMGIWAVGLTHAGPNRLADGNAVRHSRGLTRDGISLCRTLGKHGVVVDVAHLHPRCFWHLMDLTDGPVICSHTGVRERFDIQRNLNLSQAETISRRGGIVGITFNPEMLSADGKADLEHVFAHLDSLVARCGPRSVGIGSDFCGFEETAAGLEDIGGIENLKECLAYHGYQPEAIAHILGLNWLDFLEAHL